MSKKNKGEEEQQTLPKDIKKYSLDLKKELDEIHKFKWSNILWPIFSIFFIFGLLFYVYSNFIIKNTNSIMERKNPEEKILNKPEIKGDGETSEIKEVKEKEQAAPAEEKAEASFDEYKILEGDTLGAIAESKGVSLELLLKSNPGLVPETVQIGQVIKIPK